MYLLQTPTASPIPQAVVREMYFKARSRAFERDKNVVPQSEKIEYWLEALQENRSISGKHPLTSTWKRLESLYDLGENWNGGDVSAPNPDSIEKAKSWLQEMYCNTESTRHPWSAPHVTANEDGHVVLEWIHGPKWLSVYISPGEVWYVKAWGTDIKHEMSDGDVTDSSACIALWSWLME